MTALRTDLPLCAAPLVTKRGGEGAPLGVFALPPPPARAKTPAEATRTLTEVTKSVQKPTLKGQSQLSISLELRWSSCWLWLKTTWFQTKTLAVIGLFKKSILYFIERVPRNPYVLTTTVGLVTSRGLCGAFILGTSVFLRIYCLCGPLSSIPTGTGFPG